MRLVVNASPLIFLAKVDGLSLLPGCFAEVLVPPAVVTEIRDLVLPASIQRTELTLEGAAYVRGAVGRLHASELEAIVLAQERQAIHVALDDLLARNRASQLGLVPIGTVGLLLLANTGGLIGASLLKAKLRDLVDKHGFYLSTPMLEKILAALV